MYRYYISFTKTSARQCNDFKVKLKLRIFLLIKHGFYLYICMRIYMCTRKSQMYPRMTNSKYLLINDELVPECLSLVISTCPLHIHIRFIHLLGTNLKIRNKNAPQIKPWGTPTTANLSGNFQWSGSWSKLLSWVNKKLWAVKRFLNGF